jgi:hypothetical protein
MGGMGEPSGEPAPRVPDAIGPTPTPPKSDPEFDPFGGAPGDEGDDPEDPMGGMGEPGGPANPPAGTRPPDAIGPKPTPPASGTRPPDAIGPHLHHLLQEQDHRMQLDLRIQLLRVIKQE